MRKLKKFKKSKSGATAIEYALIAGFIGLMTAAIMPQMSNSLASIFNGVSSGLQSVSASASNSGGGGRGKPSHGSPPSPPGGIALPAPKPAAPFKDPKGRP